jgi:hypothetical protein
MLYPRELAQAEQDAALRELLLHALAKNPCLTTPQLADAIHYLDHDLYRLERLRWPY